MFANAGVISKVPIFDGVIDDNNGTLNPDPENEKFLSYEAGAQFRSNNRQVSLNLNLYHTTWRNRTLTRFVQNIGGVEGVDGLVNLLGVDARHMGIEADGAYQPSNLLRFDWALSLGNWKYLEDVSGTYRPDDQSSDTENYNFYISDLKVADAPQHQLALSASVYPSDAAYLSLVGMFYGDHFAQFEPFSRTRADDRAQSWQPPGYSVFHLHTSYSLGDVLPIANGGSLRVFANVYNLFDTVYIQDATDASRWNGYHDDGDRHDADSAEVFLGYPRNLNLGFQIVF